jgi:hypothetical protein
MSAKDQRIAALEAEVERLEALISEHEQANHRLRRDLAHQRHALDIIRVTAGGATYR